MSYSVSRVEWGLAAPLLKNVREKVFVCEWRIPKNIEFDQQDPRAYHILVCDDISQEPIGTGRIMPTGEISRIAVLKNYRHDPVDKVILSSLIRIAKELELNEVFISAPLSTVNYFSERNFCPIGAVFMEAGIARQRMACQITNIGMAKYYLSH
ncbi:GNAT family N-acetyltransferase [Thalassotalea sp. PLHSN55]|uniref:GNAT family N-acetyltransferase n=1 Tax=Thalassotalea sp. PLHSN55 TaxID=3435888 RepID=UPI003F869AEF